jgi:hypothetical protein
VPDIAALGTGSYSAVVSCDKMVAAVTNFSDADSGAAHEGIAEPAPTWYAPGIYNNFYTYFSNIVVQNASMTAADVEIQIFAPNNAVAVYTEKKTNVPSNAAVSFEQEGKTALQTNVPYSAKIMGYEAGTTNPANIAAVVNIYGSGGTGDQLYSYNPFKEGSTTAYAPVLYNKYYTYDTSMTIQNLGSNAAEVEVEYTTGLKKTYTIQPNSPEALYTPASGLPAANVLYGATVTSTNGEPIVLLVNESNPNNRAASYTGFATGSVEVVAPFVFKNYYTFDSSVNCQNVGAAATTIRVTYADPGGFTDYGPIDPGDVAFIYQPSDAALASVPINFQTSATMTSLTGEPIVCVVNYDFIPSRAGENLDQLYSYEAIAAP